MNDLLILDPGGRRPPPTAADLLTSKKALRPVLDVIVVVNQHRLIARHEQRSIDPHYLHRPRHQALKNLVGSRTHQADVLVGMHNRRDLPQVLSGQLAPSLELGSVIRLQLDFPPLPGAPNHLERQKLAQDPLLSLGQLARPTERAKQDLQELRSLTLNRTEQLFHAAVEGSIIVQRRVEVPDREIGHCDRREQAPGWALTHRHHLFRISEPPQVEGWDRMVPRTDTARRIAGRKPPLCEPILQRRHWNRIGNRKRLSRLCIHHAASLPSRAACRCKVGSCTRRPERRDLLAGLFPADAAQQAVRDQAHADALHQRLRQIETAENAQARDIEALAAETAASPAAIAALRSRILARFTELEDERAAIGAQLTKLQTSRQPAPDTDLLERLPSWATSWTACRPGSTYCSTTRSASNCSTATTSGRSPSTPPLPPAPPPP